MSYYSIEAEQAAIGSVILNPDLIFETTLVPNDFYHEDNSIIFESMLQLREQGKKIDVVSLASRLGQEIQNVGGTAYLLDLSRSVPSVSDFASYERIVKEKFIIRHGMESIKKIYSSGYEDPKEFVAELVGVTEELSDRARIENGFKHIGDGLITHFELLQDKKYGNKPLGASTVGTDLDRITGKWQKQTFNVVAARPSVGKTAFMLNNVSKNAKEGMTVAIFSLEQPEQQLYDRMISAECNIDGMRIKNGQLHDDEWVKYTIGLSILTELNIFIDDRPGLSIQEIRAAVRKLKKKNPDLIVYIDYIQLIKGGKKYSDRNRNEEVGYVSSSLKQMARENDCPVIGLAQLSRGVEQRQDKRPMMGDLRESGNIEQDADTISFLYRDDYYNAETDKKNIIEIIVAKNREGQTGTAEMVNLRNYGKFIDYDYRPTR
ncbi:replicative DNA helicase [Paenibacillus sp. FA6]|uniref:replicative DNA helicase n=1 Tax=Paenibacillus sp. FA6 TaxID=3413029 RepID=UPI003F654C5C